MFVCRKSPNCSPRIVCYGHDCTVNEENDRWSQGQFIAEAVGGGAVFLSFPILTEFVDRKPPVSINQIKKTDRRILFTLVLYLVPRLRK